MNVLLIGSGGREHALAWALARSPLLGKLFAAPGNPGICALADCVPLDVSDTGAVIAFCRREAVDLVVIGPEQPLVAGLVDALDAAGIKAFGPSRAAAQLEGSKSFTKDICREADIPTARSAHFTELAAARRHVAGHPLPVVVKADGLAAGKGVTVTSDRAEALAALEGIFAAPDASVVIEEFLEGEEASFFVLTDGRTILPFGTAQDHKRAYDGDRGPNTGGMGAYSPAPVLTEALIEETLERIIRPTLGALARRGILYRGVLYAGLMVTAEGPKLIEYNVRFGDPECQVLMMRLQDDLLPLLAAAASGELKSARLRWRNEAALTVVLAARGYPGAHEKGTPIGGLAAAASLPDVQVFHAGTAMDGDRIVAAGGRVLNVTALGGTIGEAQKRAYQAVDCIDWPQGFCRRDIGWRAMQEPARKRS